jgi:hypothetical protein
VIDFGRVLRDPNSPTKILALYDSGDYGHPNDSGWGGGIRKRGEDESDDEETVGSP